MEKAYRFVPCGTDEPGKLRQWLEDMARDGLLLEKIVFRAAFRKAEPQTLRYHLEPVQAAGIFHLQANRPKPELLELAQEMGWEFVCLHGAYHIYRTADPDARDFHTESETQALALDSVCRHQRNSSIFYAVYLLIILAVICSSPVLNMLRFGTVTILLLILSMPVLLWLASRSFLKFRKSQKAIREGTYEEDADWKATRTRHLVSEAVLYLAGVTAIACLLGYQMRNLGYGKCGLDEFQGNAPFVTASELTADCGTDLETASGSIQTWYTLIAPVNYEWEEAVSVTSAEGEPGAVILNADYHEAISPAVARAIAEDYLRFARFSALISPYREYSALEPYELDADHVACYSLGGTSAYVVIQQSNVVIHAQLHAPEGFPDLQDWAEAMTQMLPER